LIAHGADVNARSSGGRTAVHYAAERNTGPKTLALLVRLASAGGDQTVIVWDAASGLELRTLKGHPAAVSSVAFSPDGQRLASASGDFDHQGKRVPAEVKIWDATSGREIRTLKGQFGAINSVAFSPDGQRLAGASEDHTVKVWDVASGLELRTVKGHEFAVSSVAFSPDGQRAAGFGRSW
jgi:WD40 repeat protein